LPERKYKPFGKLTIENIDTKPKQSHFFRNLLIAIIVLIILGKLLKTNGKNKVSIISKIIAAIKGVSIPKK